MKYREISISFYIYSSSCPFIRLSWADTTDIHLHAPRSPLKHTPSSHNNTIRLHTLFYVLSLHLTLRLPLLLPSTSLTYIPQSFHVPKPTKNIAFEHPSHICFYITLLSRSFVAPSIPSRLQVHFASTISPLLQH